MQIPKAWKPGLLAKVPGRRMVPGVDRLCKKRFWIVGPELTYILVSLDRHVDKLPVPLLHLENVDVAHHVAVIIKPEGPPGVLLV